MNNTCSFIKLIKYDLIFMRKIEGYSTNLTLFNWITNFFTIRYFPVFIIRCVHFFKSHNIGIISKILSFINLMIFRIECSSSCTIGPGLYIPHSLGVVIGAYSIGSNCIIFQGVTIGAKYPDFVNDVTTRPSIGDNVLLGAGSVVLGPVCIGNNVKVGSNATITNSIPSNSTVLVQPPLILSRKE